MSDLLDECGRCGALCIAEGDEAVPAERYRAAVIERFREQAVAIKRVRAALEEDVWSDSDPHGRLQKYLDALEGRTP